MNLCLTKEACFKAILRYYHSYESVLPYGKGTTLGIYTHEFQKAQARTSDIIANALDFDKKKEPAVS